MASPFLHKFHNHKSAVIGGVMSLPMAFNEYSIEEIVCVLKEWLNAISAEDRRQLAMKFEDMYGNHEIVDASDAQLEILADLALDSGYYTENSEYLSQDPCLMGYEKFKTRIIEAMRQIETTHNKQRQHRPAGWTR